MVYPRRLMEDFSDTMSRECIAHRIGDIAYQFVDG